LVAILKVPSGVVLVLVVGRSRLVRSLEALPPGGVPLPRAFRSDGVGLALPAGECRNGCECQQYDSPTDVRVLQHVSGQ
jgi:hypothetical protein